MSDTRTPEDIWEAALANLAEGAVLFRDGALINVQEHLRYATELARAQTPYGRQDLLDERITEIVKAIRRDLEITLTRAETRIRAERH